MRKKQKEKASSGNVAIIVLGMSIMTFLVVVGMSLSSLTNTESVRLVSSDTQQQVYYVAQAGIQEALSTNFYPRSNRMAMRAQPLPAVLPANQQPQYPFSGRVIPTTLAGAQVLNGMYRYMVFGGAPERNANTGNIVQPADDGGQGYLQLVDHNGQVRQPTYVASRGAVCLQNNAVVPDSLTLVNFRPTCTVGDLRETTVLTEFRFRDPALTTNRLERSVVLPQGTETITLRTPVQFPDGTVGTNFDFNTQWETNASYAQLQAVMVYQTVNPALVPAVNRRPLNMITAPGVTNSGLTNVQPGESIRLYFRGALHRNSIYGYNFQNCFNPATVNLCNVKVQRMNANGTPFLVAGNPVYDTNAALIPDEPMLTQIIVYAPSDFSAGFTGGATYDVVVEPALQDTWGRAGGNQYRYRFQMQ
jgi:hypothetical protein